MRKLITVTIIFILSFKMNGQELDDLYANATLNTDFTSTLNSSLDETILRKEFNEWFINNESKFYFESEPNIFWEQKWYWGSTKVLFKSLSFVKPENINRRLAYLEAVRAANERNRPLSATEILHEINEILKIPQVQTGVKYIGKKINQGIDSFKESMKSSYSSNYSNDNSSNSSISSNDNQKEKNQENKQSPDNNTARLDIEFIESETTGECNFTVGKPKIRRFKAINKNNNDPKGTYNIIEYKEKYYESCPDSILPGSVKMSDITIKQYLINQYNSAHPFSDNPDSFTLTEK